MNMRERNSSSRNFAISFEFPETHVHHYLQQGLAGHVALDVWHPAANEIEVDFKFRDSEPRGRSPHPTREDASLDEISKVISSVVTDCYLRPPSKHDVQFELSFDIGREDLPARGLIAAMLGMGSQGRNHELVLTGAQVAIDGELTETISWYLYHPLIVSGILRSQMRRQLCESFLLDGLELLRERFERLVLEEE